MAYFKKIEALMKLKIKPNSDINNITTLLKMNMNTLSNKCELMNYITENLRPKKQDVKKYGAVYTPPTLIEEMVSKIPIEVWSNKNLKWLGPGCGIGNFEVCIYYRLMDGLKDVIPCEEERKKHILEDMLYVVELDPKSVHIYKQIFEGSKYALNVFEGSFLEFTPAVFGLHTFDIIVGNPPYQEVCNHTNKSIRAGGKNLYTKFLEKSMNMLKEGGFLLFITPPIITPSSPLFKAIFQKKQVEYININ
jgi:type I restriction-modification system DNA methylase subunit